jgi:ubiquinone/menaquinone biosynthesis C-methylase UbiE
MPKEALDFGCGTGLLTFALSPYAATIYGYDPSSEMQRIFRSKLDAYQTKNVRLISGEEMKERTFDVIFSSMVFHHIGDIIAELLGLRRLLAPDGRLMLIDLDKDDGAFHRHEPGFNGHNGFERNELRRVLESCGFHEVSISTVYEGVRQIGNDPVEYSLFMATARRKLI